MQLRELEEEEEAAAAAKAQNEENSSGWRSNVGTTCLQPYTIKVVDGTYRLLQRKIVSLYKHSNGKIRLYVCALLGRLLFFPTLIAKLQDPTGFIECWNFCIKGVASSDDGAKVSPQTNLKCEWV